MRIRRLLVLATAAALLPGLAACGGVVARPQLHTYRLAYRPPAASAARVAGTVRVVPFGIAAAYDRQSFIYRESPHDIGVDPYHQWIAAPAAMITDLVARDLAAAGAFEAVLQAPSALPATYELNGWIETFEERDDEGCVAHVRLRALFVRVPPRGAREVLFQESLTGDEACPAGDPDAFAAAMSRAVQRLSDEIRARAVAAAHQPPAPDAP
jgi:ABC-type uncharacterized transport system auxiliary subunit